MRRRLGWLDSLDARLSAGLAILATPPRTPALRWLRAAVTVIAHLGDGILWVALGFSAYFLYPAEGSRIVSLAAVVLVVALIVSVLKLLSRRQRPLHADGRGFFQGYDRYAFPSGHAARMFCLAVLIGAAYPGWGWALCPLAAGVALARVVLGVHHLADVFVGGVIGALTAWMGWMVFLKG
jgi:membrane-associated phospholipid phosphatase